MKTTSQFLYTEPLNDEKASKLYSSLRINEDIVPESLLIRLIGGTLNLKYKFCDSIIKNRTNYFTLGMYENKPLSLSSIKRIFPSDSTEEQINKYFKFNRNNTSFFERLLFETSNFFMKFFNNENTAAFVHLYRIIEHISFSFPLIYTAHSNSFLNSFEELKEFINGSDKKELGFFKTFQNRIIDRDSLGLTFTLNFLADEDLAKMALRLFTKLRDENIISIEDFTTDSIEIKYSNIFSLILNLRNRYFHMTSKSYNFLNTDLNMEYIFSLINSHGLNWVFYVYSEILALRMRQVL